MMAAARSRERVFLVGIARAAAGAVVFALPLMMTMEMWWLGMANHHARLVVLYVLLIPLLVGLSYYAGFEDTYTRRDDVLDAFVAYAVGFAASALVLALFAVVGPDMPASEVVGKVSLQAVPASVGALLARRLLGAKSEEEEKRDRRGGYGGELFHMLVGALFFALNVAPTEEIVLIGHMMSDWHAVALAAASLLVMHGFVYAVEFEHQSAIPEGVSWWSAFLRFTVVGYALALGVSLFSLWVFGRTDGLSPAEAVFAAVVLGFPAAIGAAGARLLL